MVFSSMTFLFAFLPVVVLVYMLSPKQMKNAILLIASLFFYAWGEPRNILLMLLSIGINYVFGRIIEADRASQSKMRVWNLGFAVFWNVLMLGIFKYVSGISQTLHAMLPSLIPVVKIALPIGISFYTFQAISYLVDVYRGTTRAQNNLINFALYIAMFPQLIAGPIVRYEDVEQQIRSRKVTIAGFGVGCEFFIRGMVKKVLFANLLGQIFVRIQALSNVQSSIVTAWIGAKHIRNLLIVWGLTGVWHGAGINFLLWGLYYGVLLIIEKYLIGGFLKKHKVIGHTFTLIAVVIGWMLFANTSFASLGQYFCMMFGIGKVSFFNATAGYFLRTSIVLLVLGVLFSTPIMHQLGEQIFVRYPKVSAAVRVFLFLLCIAALVYQTYNPFLYFRF